VCDGIVRLGHQVSPADRAVPASLFKPCLAIIRRAQHGCGQLAHSLSNECAYFVKHGGLIYERMDMAKSSCPKCSGTSFELQEAPNIKGARFKHSFIQCSSCGAVISVMEHFNISELLNKIAAKLGFKLFD
jgi:uncharacterized protein with PIN domain